MEINQARKLLFRQHQRDIKKGRGTALPDLEPLSVYILTAPKLGVDLDTGVFVPVGHHPNIPESELVVGIYFDYKDAIDALNRTKKMVLDNHQQLDIMFQGVSYSKAIGAVAIGAHAYICFGGDNKLFLPSELVASYKYLERQKSLAEYSFREYNLAVALGIDVEHARIIDAAVQPFRGLVEIELSTIDAGDGSKPALIIVARERKDVVSSPQVDRILQGNRVGLVEFLCGDGKPFSDVMAIYLPAHAIELGPRAFN